ncbi:hypothetical protein HER18_07680 [Chryseobacterium sp. NEB161]|nr:hypothetical protein HER18_07680 [Chryseobacterium sp. NEB161]
MAETPKNTLKQWFVTGAKPLQAQYWAWLDSYWHKSEPISINAIDGLGEILVNKVDADQLALYAKKDASNIDVPTWKTKLGVGELPPNIGTIDYVLPSGEAMIGNAYKKVKQPNDGKTYLLKIDGTAVDGDTFGKNVSNSYLTSLPNTGLKLGAIWELDSNGFPLRFKNLPAKDTDPTIQKKMVVLPDGTVGLRDLNDITVNIPEEFSSTATVASTTITVNHIYPNPVPPPPDYGDQLNAIMKQYKDLIFTPITGTDVDIITPNNLSLDVNKYEPQTKFFQLRISQAIVDTGLTPEVKVVPKNYILPQDKNWVVRFVLNDFYIYETINTSKFIQLIQSDNFPRQYIDCNGSNVWQKRFDAILPSGQILSYADINSTMFLFVKVGSVINIQVYSGSRCVFESVSATQEFGNYKPCLRLISGNVGSYFKSTISYSILP